MPLTLTTYDNLVRRVGSASRLLQYAEGDTAETHPNIDKAIEEASDAFRSAALNKYTEESVDALTAEDCPPEVRRNVESLVLGYLTDSDDRRPENIKDAFDKAEQWLRWLAAGKVHIAELTRISYSGSSSRVVGPSTAAENVFSRNPAGSTATEYQIRNPKI